MYYKVLWRTLKGLQSFNSPWPLVYQPNIPTYKPNDGGPLAVFQTLQNAQSFIQSHNNYLKPTEIWECDIEKCDSLVYGLWCEAGSYFMAISRMHRFYLPTGTVLAQSVTIRRRVYPEVNNDPAAVE